MPKEYNIVNSNGEITWGPFDDELAAHNKLKQLLDRAIDDECEGLKVI